MGQVEILRSDEEQRRGDAAAKPGAWQWLVERRRIGPVVRELEALSIRCSIASVSTLSRANERQRSLW